MGLFTRNRAPEVNSDLWQPLGGLDVQHDSAAEIAGDSAVMSHAYRVHYTLASAPHATLVIWTYAVPADPEGSSPGPYAVGYRGECWLGDVLDAAWNEQDWEGYNSPAAADDAAYAYAEQDARTPDRGELDDLPFFEWDGQPCPGSLAEDGA